MGECGCGEMEIIRDVISIAGKVMVVESYTGCNYCHEGLAITLYIFSPKEAKEFGMVPNGKFEPDQFGNVQKIYPIIDQPDLIEALKDLPEMEHYTNMGDWMTDNGRDLLKRSTHICLKRILDE